MQNSDRPRKMPNVPPFVKFVCANVPMVFDDSLSYYEALCALWKYVQGMTDVINNNATLEEEYILKFDELKSYVENYFDNLDVQEEINNKLDAMVEDGTLQEIIYDYLQPKVTWTFDSISDMQTDENLVAGTFAKTMGYYSVNDGGEAEYKIRAKAPEETADGSFTIALGDDLIAELIINEEINIKQLGARAGSDYDIKPYLDAFENKCIADDYQYALYIPMGNWYTSPKQFTRQKGLKIRGCTNAMKGASDQCTTLLPVTDGQSYLLKFGNDASGEIAFADLMRNYEVDNLVFEGTFSDSALVLAGLLYSSFGLLNFRYVEAGHCMRVTTCWEDQFDKIIFRVIKSHESAIYFDEHLTVTGVATNLSALQFNYISFESMNCTFIETHELAWFVHNTFNIIECERSFADEAYDTLPAGVTEADCERLYMFKGWFDKTTINSINHNNLSDNIYHKDADNNWYVYAGIFTDNIAASQYENYEAHNYHISVGTLMCTGKNKCYICESTNSQRTALLTIGTLHNRDLGEKLYRGENGITLKIGSLNNSTSYKRRNMLMPYLEINSKSTTQNNPFVLKNVSDSFDVTGCAIKALATGPIPCQGVNTIKLKCKLVSLSDGSDYTGSIVPRTKKEADASWTVGNYIALTAGMNDITLDIASDYNSADYYNLQAVRTNEAELLIYAIEYTL